MEGNFYVSTSSVTIESKGKLASAYLGCQEQSEVYGKCIEKCHANKELKKDSCLAERTMLRQCIDENISRSRVAEAEVLLATQQQQQKQNSAK